MHKNKKEKVDICCKTLMCRIEIQCLAVPGSSLAVDARLVASAVDVRFPAGLNSAPLDKAQVDPTTGRGVLIVRR